MKSYPGLEDLNTRDCALEGSELFGSTIFLAFSICGEEGYKLGIFVEKLATNTFIEELFFKLN